MLFVNFLVVVTSIQSVLSCPAAKKSSLRADDVQDYHRKLSQIIGLESQRLTATVSQMNQPVCSNPLFTAVSRGTPGTAATNANIQTVYEGVRTFFYALVDSIQNGNVQPALATQQSLDPLSLFPITAPAPTNLNVLQKAYRVANLLGSALRLVFHDAGEVDIRTLDLFGSDGCLSDSGPNSGLKEKNTIAMTIIEPLWQNYCHLISRADFWVLFGKIAAESALPNGRFTTFTNQALLPPGAAALNPTARMPYLNIPFQYGRKDAVGTCDGGAFRKDGVTHRLPGHQPGLSEFTKVYVKQMGLSVRDGVVLSGAHSVGHVHTQFSGFGFNDDLKALEAEPLTNAWDESPWTFDNEYYDSLALEFWLNKPAQPNVIINEGGNTANPLPSTPANSGANFWGVEVAPGVLEPVPVCVALGTCGIAAIAVANPRVPNAAALQATTPPGVEVIFCVTNGITRYSTRSLEVDPTGAWTTLNEFANPLDTTNTCNCAQFFSIPGVADPAILTARGCAISPHPKTVMLNADMVQNFPISAAGGAKNLISSGAGILNDIGTGVFGELCAPFVVSQNPATPPASGRLNSNIGTANTQLTFPEPLLVTLTTVANQGFGCVSNSVGNPPHFLGMNNVQNVASTLLPKDPNKSAVSLWATVQQFLTLPLPGTCIEGISVYNNPLDGSTNPYTGALQTAVPNYDTYSGRVVVKTARGGFIGQNGENGLVTNELTGVTAGCTDATPPNGEGRDNFYREFEVAWVKMVTVGFSYSHTFSDIVRVMNGVVSSVTVPYTAPGNGKLGALFDIILKNPRQRRDEINSGATLTPILPPGITWIKNFRTMTGGPLYGSSTCYLYERVC